MKQWIIAGIGGIGLLVGCTPSSVETASQEFNQLPPAVQQTVRDKAPAAEVADVEQYDRQGRTIYRVEFRDPKRNPPLEVAADGMIVKYEAGTEALGNSGSPVETNHGAAVSGNPVSALPVGVQRAIEANAPKAQVQNIVRREENGQIVYEVEYAGREPRPTMRVTADGTILKRPGEESRRGTNDLNAAEPGKPLFDR